MSAQQIDLAAFVQAVREMRAIQKRFFSGERTVVAEAKQLERAVDIAIERYDAGQGQLFSEVGE